MLHLLIFTRIRYGVEASLDTLPVDITKKIDDSVKFLQEELALGHSVYGKLVDLLSCSKH